MAAPALVALAHGSRDPRSAATITALVDEVRSHAPRPARRAGVPRAVQAVLRRRSSTGWSGRGHDEIVVVPLLLTEAYHAKVDVPGAIAEASARHDGLRIRATQHPRPRGRASSRCSTCACARRCSEARVRELDALVLAAAGSSDPLANQAVARLARVWGAQHKLPVTAAFASAAPPATGEAVRAFRAEGRRHIAVASLFLAPGLLPDRAAELALEAGAVAVSEPLGAHPELARTILARYAVGAVELVPV